MPGNAGIRAGPGRGPGTPDSTGACSPEAGADGLPFRVRSPRRPEPGDIAARDRDRVILSDHDLAVMKKAVAWARQDGQDDQQDAAVGQHGTGPGPGPPAEGRGRPGRLSPGVRRHRPR